MKIKHNDLYIPKLKNENPFQNCKLGRDIHAMNLTQIVKSFPDGFVLSINNEWGAGKTTFVKMWQQYLSNNGFKTVYFNAWENDFDTNPLVALVAELEPIIKSKPKFKKVMDKAGKIGFNILPAVAKGISNKLSGSEDFANVVEVIIKSSTEIFTNEVNIYNEKKKNINEFRSLLTKFIQEKTEDKPLVFIIDELDRCRPDYAVEVLEQIKHLFSVEGIVFVLSIDKIHLASSIKGFYGSPDINTDEYLRRFINLEYTLPQPNTNNFVYYLYEYYQFDDILTKINSVYFKENFLKAIIIIFNKSNLSLRKQENIFAMTRLVMTCFKDNWFQFLLIIFIIITIKITKPVVYFKIRSHNLDIKSLLNELEVLFEIKEVNDCAYYIFRNVIWLIFFYNNNLNISSSAENYKNLFLLRENEIMPMFKSNLMSNDNIKSIMSDFLNYEFKGIKLSALIEKIELKDPIFIND